MSGDFKRSLGGYRPQSVIEEAMNAAGTDDVLSRAQYADLVTWLPGRMLVKSDRTAMAHGPRCARRCSITSWSNGRAHSAAL
ncbi:MAG: hypothetical protein R3C58_00035 [Parvularculaceae bacterium]